MKRLVFDLDGTLTHINRDRGYADVEPNLDVIAKLRDYKAAGFTIVIATSRNMRTYGASVGLITAKTLPVIFAWLDRHEVPYDEVMIGKPWCGEEGFYVDDKAIRPSEFVAMSYEEITAMLEGEADRHRAA